MKIKINRNILWAEIFTRRLVSEGVKYACVSPGSRSTPLTYAVASNRNIKSFVHIDERSCAFFAAGLARKTGSPVMLICTSGTAVAGFYPAVIEAFQQRIPLIVCTADRPAGSFLRGVNQTINQNNFYKNHIRWFTDAGLPDIKKLDYIDKTASKAARQSKILQGPVHINFPFDKPFEPDNYTDEIEESLTEIKYSEEPLLPLSGIPENIYEKIRQDIHNNPNGLITVGPSAFPPSFRNAVIKLSEISGYPVLADGVSRLRCGEIHPNILVNYDALFRSGFFEKYKPSIILHFGGTLTSKGYEEFAGHYNGLKYLINKYDEIFDPSGRYTELITAEEENFINTLITGFENTTQPQQWISSLIKAEAIVCRLKEEHIYSIPFPDEGRIITEIMDIIPDNSNLMLSNSMPVRDFDYFAGTMNKNIQVFHNRGASGIDGIVSTALGIAAEGEPTVLITGDLAFYHDMNGLLAAKNNKIPLIIILINNNGGGIFQTLPVSEYPEIFDRFFTTPHNLDFKNFAESYGAYFKEITGWDDLKRTFTDAAQKRILSVLEIKTDSLQSLQHRKKFWQITRDTLNDNSAF